MSRFPWAADIASGGERASWTASEFEDKEAYQEVKERTEEDKTRTFNKNERAEERLDRPDGHLDK